MAQTETSWRQVETVLVTGLPGCGRTSLVRNLLSSLPAGAAAHVCSHRFAKAFGLETTSLWQAGTSPPPALAGYSEVFDFGSGCVCCRCEGPRAAGRRCLLTKLPADLCLLA